MLDRLPPEIVLDDIFPLLKAGDILAIGSSSRSLHALILEPTIWKRKLNAHSPYIALRILAQSQRPLDWQTIYRRSLSPQLYVWGVAASGRLGIDLNDKRMARGNCVPSPICIDAGIDLVKIVAGNTSFHGLGCKGEVVFWGEYGGDTVPFGNPDYRNPGLRVTKPTRLDLPFRTVDVSAGRTHALFLTDNGHVYQSICCALPHRIVHPFLENDSIVQIGAGWRHSAILLKSGTIIIFWPHDCSLREDYTVGYRAGPRQTVQDVFHGESLSTRPFDFEPDSVTLPPIRDESVVQISNAKDAVLALTASNRLYRMDFICGRPDLRGSERVQNINEMFINGSKRWNEMKSFAPDKLQKLLPEGTEEPRISHITCSQTQFSLYASSNRHNVLLKGMANTDDAQPKPFGVNNAVEFARGDGHALLLTRDGEVSAWGEQKGGRLGVTNLDHTRDDFIAEPLPVSFSWDRRTFAFTVAAAGFQSAALVIDLDGSNEEFDDEEKRNEWQHFQQRECLEIHNSLTNHP
ncbi:hypothetical protein E3P96_01669 [Wallemia ichthyophaga]|nr:hypothetical protein E3P96_01669 [Wallemia ichthyophaga]